jgi:putative heme-binding domain-containing protein
MAADSSLRVRYQLAFTIGEARQPDSAQLLAAILLRAPSDLWLHTAIFSSLADGAGDLFVNLAGDARLRSDPIIQEWLRRLVAMIGVNGRAEDLAQVVTFMDQLQSEPQLAFPLLFTLGDALHRAGRSLAAADPDARLKPFFLQAMNAGLNYSVADPLRVGGLRLLGVGPDTFATVGDLMLLQLGTGQTEAVESAALATLGRFDDPRIAPAVIQRWRALTPHGRGDAVTALLAQRDRVVGVLAALENGTISSAELSCAQVNFLRAHRDPAISERAVQLFGPVPRQRPEAVQRFRPALSLKGTPALGQNIFRARCAACHQQNDATQAMGPDLAGARIQGRERILSAILEPNVTVRRDYLTYVVETTEGEPLIGLLRDETPATVTLQRLEGGPVILRRANITYQQAQLWSLMPEGLEAGLTPQNMADLLEYISIAPF